MPIGSMTIVIAMPLPRIVSMTPNTIATRCERMPNTFFFGLLSAGSVLIAVLLKTAEKKQPVAQTKKARWLVNRRASICRHSELRSYSAERFRG